jgi:hypothetical protein
MVADAPMQFHNSAGQQAMGVAAASQGDFRAKCFTKF